MTNKDKLIVEFYQDLDNPTQLSVEIVNVPDILRGQLTLGEVRDCRIGSSSHSEFPSGDRLWLHGRHRDLDVKKLYYCYRTEEKLKERVRDFKIIISNINKDIEEGRYE